VWADWRRLHSAVHNPRPDGVISLERHALRLGRFAAQVEGAVQTWNQGRVCCSKRTGRVSVFAEQKSPATLEKQISDERYSLQELAKALNARILRLAPRDAQELLNVNTPADWAVARQRWRTSRRENWS